MFLLASGHFIGKMPTRVFLKKFLISYLYWHSYLYFGQFMRLQNISIKRTFGTAELSVNNGKGANNKQYPMAGDCVKKIYYFYQTLLQCESWLFQTATGFACKTLAIMPSKEDNNLTVSQ